LETFSKTLDQQGIAVYITNSKSLEGVFANLRKLGELFGDEGSGNRLVSSLSARVDAVRNQEVVMRSRVFMQISNDPLFTIGSESFLTELIEQAGGVSVTKDVPTAYPKLSKETAAALDPDVIILSDSDDNREPSSVFNNSKAVKNGRVHRINADIISRPGPRLVDALAEIAKMLRTDVS
jgi:iron complex transport system substrate-binding protein